MTFDSSTGFLFQDDSSAVESGAAIVVQIPAGIRDKQFLLRVLAAGLSFPDYFGWNWDALDECLRDLSWIKASGTVVLRHSDVPFEDDSDNRAIYTEILKEAIAAARENDRHKLVIIFPTNPTAV